MLPPVVEVGRMSDELQGLPGDFLARLVGECADAIVYADGEGRIRYWNDAASRIFGFIREEALGASLDLIIPECLRDRHWQGYREVIGGRPSRYAAGALLAVPAHHKDGHQISVEFTILPFRTAGAAGAAGALVGIAAIMREVTARFEETRALRREVAELRAAAAAATKP
jgi:PAS domain S-box-containing protein